MRPDLTALATAALLLLAACGADEPVGAPEPSDASTVVPVAPAPYAWSGEGCTRAGCHLEVEAIRDPASEMMQQIFERGTDVGDGDGCVVCHGGTPNAETAELAHVGTVDALAAEGGPDTFFADPASPWVNARSCGPCHEDHVRAQWSSLMMTESGKIQGTTWGFGALEGYEHTWGNYDIQNPEDPHAQLGTDAYREYMRVKRDTHPNVYPDAQEVVPEAPTAEEAAAHPERAAFTYIRAECQRCHLGVRGRFRRGDFRGMGCGACHVPYGNEGLYEGSDTAIDPDEPGHPLVHAMQATRESVVSVHGEAYTGIPVETCTTCHNRGKRIGVSYQGLMESAWGSPFTEGGGGQLDLHSKHYMSMQQDIHYQRGMLCQDCHTSLDVHGDGMLAGTNLAAVEIECSDCHGTPDAYPWELPLGWGDENGPGEAEGPARGVGRELSEMLQQGAPAEVADGYLLSARGNPMPDVTRHGNQVIVHTVGGRDLPLRPLRAISEADELDVDARVAMVHVDSHVRTMECYACHTQWAPQCYGCHIEIDYSDGNTSFDWVAAGNQHLDPARRAAPDERDFGTMLAGEVTEMRSFLRWEDPPLGINGEGRVTPVIPGCQTTVTVIGPDGEDVIRNRIFRTPPHTEGGGEEGQLGIDMSPVQPHTVGPARPCESCHGPGRAAGYGVGGTRPWDQGTTVDLTTADGRVLPRSARFQIEPIEGLQDWSALVTPDGQQLQTVGHHFEGSGPLDARQRALLDRRGVCVGCHQEIPEASLAVSALHHIAEYTGQIPVEADEHNSLIQKISLTAAWGQVGGGFAVGLGVGLAVLIWVRRRRA
ncbi:MAG: cytochrome C [Sandaracinaceae bacterium]